MSDDLSPFETSNYIKSLNEDTHVQFSLNPFKHYPETRGMYNELQDIRVRRSPKSTYYLEQGIVKECCYNACDMNTLMSYCSTYQ